MNLIGMFLSLSIVGTCVLASVQTITNSFKANTTVNIKTDIDTFVFNAQGVSNIQPSCPTSQFCYIHDSTVNGQTFMVFRISTPVYGGQLVQRLKPIASASNSSNNGGGNSNGNNNSHGNDDDGGCDGNGNNRH